MPLQPVAAPQRRGPLLTVLGGGLLAVLMVAGTAGAASAALPPTAPDGERVDLETPVFSDPTAIDNPLFPIAELTQVVQLGEEAGETLRTEATLLSDTKTIAYDGQQVETLVQQYVAYLDGRILEVALDFYAQADDGAVWYLGENVFNYEDGVVVDTEGTWLAGRDGPAGMIMPADPQVGDAYRPENIPGFVFEETTVQEVGVTVDGPRGPVDGAIVVEEILMDGSREEKVYAPGYGEFQAKTTDELITVAVAVPTDSLRGRLPGELRTLQSEAAHLFRAAADGEPEQLADSLDELQAAWESYQEADVPSLLDAQLSDALDALSEAVDGGDAEEVRQGAIAVGLATADLHLQYRDPARVDLTRLTWWSRQRRVDAAARDRGAVAGDVATLEAIRDRISFR